MNLVSRGDIAEMLGWTLNYKEERQSLQNSLSTRVKDLLGRHGIHHHSKSGHQLMYDRQLIEQTLKLSAPPLLQPTAPPPSAPEHTPDFPPDDLSLGQLLILLGQKLQQENQVAFEVRSLRKENAELRGQLQQLLDGMQALIKTDVVKPSTGPLVVEVPQKKTYTFNGTPPHDADVYWDQAVTPTELGLLLQPMLSPVETNRVLKQMGFQYHVGNPGQWKPTPKAGELYANVTTVQRDHGTFPQVLWKRRVVHRMLAFLNA